MFETPLTLARYVFRGDPVVLGLPDTPLRATRQGERVALWQGPDEWLLLQPEAAPPPVVGIGSLVEISHRQIALVVSGPDAEARLNIGCPLDLSEARFPVDMTTRTIFGKADIMLWRTAPDRFQIEVWRSFADYVQGVLGTGP